MSYLKILKPVDLVNQLRQVQCGQRNQFIELQSKHGQTSVFKSYYMGCRGQAV